MVYYKKLYSYASGTAQAVLDHAQPGPRLIFSCGWHITMDGKDVYPPSLRRDEKLARWFGRLTRIVDIDDQVEACRGGVCQRHPVDGRAGERHRSG